MGDTMNKIFGFIVLSADLCTILSVLCLIDALITGREITLYHLIIILSVAASSIVVMIIARRIKRKIEWSR